jgi:hypothetical protein
VRVLARFLLQLLACVLGGAFTLYDAQVVELEEDLAVSEQACDDSEVMIDEEFLRRKSVK